MEEWINKENWENSKEIIQRLKKQTRNLPKGIEEELNLIKLIKFYKH